MIKKEKNELKTKTKWTENESNAVRGESEDEVRGAEKQAILLW